MLINERTSSAHEFGWQKNKAVSKKLRIPQLMTIMVIFFFNTQILEIFPLRIGPLTPIMMMELLAFVVIMPFLPTYLRNLGTRDRYLFFIGTCMFALSLINLSGDKGEQQQKSVFTSMYAYFFIVTFFSGHPEFDIWLRRLLLFPAFAAIYAIGTDLFSNISLLSLDSRIRDNYSAMYLSLIIPICWTQLQNERGLFRLLNIVVLVTTPIVLVLTASRASFVVFAVVIIAMLMVKTPAKKAIFFVSATLIFLTLFFLLPEQSAFRNRISSLQNPVSALEVDRIALWKAALLSIKENPLFGGNFRENVQRLVLEAAPESNYARHIIYDMAGGNFGVHNAYLAVMVDFGIIIAFLFFGFFISLGKALLQARLIIRNDINHRLLSAGYICLIGYAIGSFAYHNYMGQNYFILWAILQASIKNSLILQKETKV